jgi:hypothetical protein
MMPLLIVGAVLFVIGIVSLGIAIAKMTAQNMQRNNQPIEATSAAL